MLNPSRMLLCLCIMVISLGLSAQAGSYSLTTSSATFSPLSAGIDLNSLEVDDARIPVPIGFDFTFEGITDDTLVVSSNGWASFGNPGSNHTINDLDNVVASSRPLIAPLWDDLAGASASSSKASYQLSGTAPNRVFTMEWLNWEWRYTATAAVVSFQMRLYEGSNEIEFTYRWECAACASTPSASIGLSGSSSFLSVTGIGSSSVTKSNTVEDASIDTVVTDQTLRFAPPACPAPAFGSFSNLKTDSVTINWTSSASGPWQIEWGPAGFTQGSSGTNISSSANKMDTIGGLTAGTSYDFYLRTNCGGGVLSAWVGPFTVTTVYVPPYFEDFSNGYPGTDFGEAAGLIANPTVFSSTSSSDWGEDGFANVGSSGSARINIWSTTKDEWMIGPAIDLGSGTVYQLEFDAALTPFAGTGTATLGVDDTVKVVISTDNGLSWSDSNSIMALHSGTSISNGNGTHFVASLAGYSGVVKFAFYAESTVSNADNDFFVDNIQVRVPPLCPDPLMFSQVQAAGDSITLSWSSAAGNFNLEYGVAPYTLGGGGNSVATTDTFLVINNLSAGTTYEFYLQADCSPNGMSAFVGPLAYTTPCAPVSAPFTESFEDASPSRICWSNDYIVGNQDWTYAAGSSGGAVNAAYAGNLNARFSSGSSLKVTRLLSPYIDVSSLNVPYLRFYYAQEEWFGDQNELRVYARGVNSSSWKLVFTDTSNVPAWQQGQALLLVNSDTIQLAFEGRDEFGRANVLDEVMVVEAPACPDPNFDSISNISVSAATLHWTGLSNLSNIAYGPVGFSQGTPTANVRGVTSPYTLTGLTDNFCYDVFVQDSCGGGNSGWVGPYSFCTPPTCPAPTNPGVQSAAITRTSAPLFFTPGGVATDFNISYGPAGTAPAAGTIVNATNDTVLLSGLQAGTLYEFYVRDSCGQGDVSTWTGPASFVTAFNTNYLQDFSNASPFGWSEADGRLLANTVFTANSSSWGQDIFANSGNNNAARVNIWLGNQYEWYISPSIYLDPALSNLQVEFDVSITSFNNNAQGYFGSDDSLVVVISTDNGQSWSAANVLWYADATDTVDFNGEHIVVPLTGYSGYVRFGLYAGSVIDDPEDNDWFVDNFEVRTPAPCSNPSALTVSNITTDSVQLRWTAGDLSAVDWTLFYVEGALPIDSATVISGVQVDSLMINGLKAGTYYCIYLLEQCASGFSDTIGPLCFATACPVQAIAAPFTEDFEGEAPCWSQELVIGNHNWSVATGSTGGNIVSAYNGDKNAQFTSSNGGPFITKYITPAIDASGLTVTEVSFWYAQEVWAGDQNYLNVYYRDNPSAPWIFLWGDSANVSSWTRQALIIPSLSSTLEVAFEGVDNWGRGNVLDDVYIGEAQSACPPPSALAVTVLGCDSVQVSWNSATGTTASGLEYGFKGYSPGSGVQVMGVSSPYVLTGLDLDTEYDIYIADSCGSGVSIAVGPASFETDSVGPVLASFSHQQSDTSLTNATVTFNAAGSKGDGLSYSWDFDGSNGSGINPTNIYAANGSYSVTLTVTDRCGNSDDTTITVAVAGINVVENAYQAELLVFPNPSTGDFRVRVSDGSAEYDIELYDVGGKKLYKQTGLIPGREERVSLRVAPGVYLLRFVGNGLDVTQRVIVN